MDPRIEAELSELETQIDALRQIAAGYKGMGVNIVKEKAARIPSQLRRIRKLLAAPVVTPAAKKACAHGHHQRQVGCVSCVMVFDELTEHGYQHAKPAAEPSGWLCECGHSLSAHDGHTQQVRFAGDFARRDTHCSQGCGCQAFWPALPPVAQTPQGEKA